MSSENNNLYAFEDFCFDLKEKTLWFKDERIPLAPRVLETLCVLIENSGRLMTKGELMDEIWGDTFVEERNLTQNIFTLRKEFKQRRKGIKFIETVPRRGYRFVAELHLVQIEREETLAVSHRKQMHITAEGTVSKQELAEAVKEITKDLMAGRRIEADEPQRIEASKSKPSFYLNKNIVLALSLIILLTAGTVFWSYRNNIFDSRKPVFAQNLKPTDLNFERLTDSGKVFFPCVSPDNQFIAYVVRDNANKYSVRVKHLATDAITTVVEPSEKGIAEPAFSADGHYLFYRQEEISGGISTINKVPVFGGSPQIIFRDHMTNVLISPDGKHLAFLTISASKEQKLVVCDGNTGENCRTVLERKQPEYFGIWSFRHSWSPDSKRILVEFHTESTPENPKELWQMMSVDIADGSFEEIKVPEWNRYIQAKWMPDGKSIIFLAREKANSPFQIWQVEYPGGEARRITNDANDYRYFDIASDGSFLITSQEKEFYNLWTVPVDDFSKAKQLTFSSELKHGMSGISWTPDGKKLVYALIENVTDSSVWTLDLESLQTRQITFDEAQIDQFPKITPDGKNIIFASNRKDGFHIWQVGIDGTNLRQITGGVGENVPNVSPDGKWLVYVSPPYTGKEIWKKSLEDKNAKPIKLVNATGETSISPDMKYMIVSYFGKGLTDDEKYRYGIVSFAPTDKIQDIGFNPGGLTNNNWKADSSGFYYIDREPVVNNIWFYNIADGSKQKITDFKELQMSRISISPDYQTFAVSRGKKTSNLFKITGFR